MNSNMSEDLKKVNADSTPDMGTRVPAGKDRGYNDTLTAKHTKESVRQTTVDEGACQRANDKQQGKHRDNETHPNSGCCDC